MWFWLYKTDPLFSTALLLVSGGLWLGDMKKQVFPAVRTELSAGCGDGVLFALGFPRRSDPEGPSGSRIGLRGTGDTRVW